MKILKLQPIFKEAVWGGGSLAKFGYSNAGEMAGECWGISAHRNGDCIITNKELKGKTLSWCYENHREYFGGIKDLEFPLLVKIIGASQDLSIQVHPNDEYAATHEAGSLGKTECWYILDCDENATIVIGHNAKDKTELREMIEDERWSELISIRPIKPGDFFHIEPGCLHAIKGGTLLIETQQSSDVTYRVYDYDRLNNGRKRPLHVEQSIDCITAPHRDYEININTYEYKDAKIIRYVECEYFILEKWIIKSEYNFIQNKSFMNVSVIEGGGTINGEQVDKGEHFILTAKAGECSLTGEMVVMVSYLPQVSN